MKSVAILFLLSSALGASIPQDKKHVLSGVLGRSLGAIPTQKAASIEKMPAAFGREGVERIKIKYGPYKIRGANSTERFGNSVSMDPHGTAWNYMTEDDFPKDITILVAKLYPEYEDGSPADMKTGMYEHHLTYVDVGRAPEPIVSCGNKKFSAGTVSFTFVIGGAAENTNALYTTVDGKFNSGFYVPKNMALMQVGDMVNYSNETKSIYSVVEVEYLKGSPPGFMDASTQLINVAECDTSPFSLTGTKDQKVFNMRGKPMTATRDGFLLATKAHLHDGGDSVVLLQNGKTLCESKAVYRASNSTEHKESGIIDMTSCLGPMEIKKGDVLEIEARYDLEKHPLRPHIQGGMAEGMAYMGSTFATALRKTGVA